MTIRVIVVVGLLIIGSGAFGLAQGGKMPGIVADAVRLPPAKTVLTTPPVIAAFLSCRLVNVGKTALEVSTHTMKFFDESGTEILGNDTRIVYSDCGQLLQPGQFCFTSLYNDPPTPTYPFQAYCQMSVSAKADDVRGAMQVVATTNDSRVLFPGSVVEAR
jgi:hypothetical protein